VINNIEFDHADIYDDLAAVRLAFQRLVNLVPKRGLTLLGIDSDEAAKLAGRAFSRVQTFGTAESAEWRAVDIRSAGARTTFRLLHQHRDEGDFEMPLVGAHNVRNALAAIAVGRECGIAIDTLRAGLRDFLGVKRRLEVVGTRNDVVVYDDFAHHPTAVAETLTALRAAQPDRRIWAIFEPRSASSCRRIFQDDFARAFASADEVVIASVYRSSLPAGERLSEDRLVADLRSRGTPARHLPDVETIVRAISIEAKPGDLIVVMSNGGFGGIHRKLLGALG
jgi:UDP-N-acetylmuramate: L-alanyl-gamma-D-glutamyl-meso-diaminopimelate ligase